MSFTTQSWNFPFTFSQLAIEMTIPFGYLNMKLFLAINEISAADKSYTPFPLQGF